MRWIQARIRVITRADCRRGKVIRVDAAPPTRTRHGAIRPRHEQGSPISESHVNASPDTQHDPSHVKAHIERCSARALNGMLRR